MRDCVILINYKWDWSLSHTQLTVTPHSPPTSPKLSQVHHWNILCVRLGVLYPRDVRMTLFPVGCKKILEIRENVYPLFGVVHSRNDLLKFLGEGWTCLARTGTIILGWSIWDTWIRQEEMFFSKTRKISNFQFMFLLYEMKRELQGIHKKGCRCYERQKAKTGRTKSLSHKLEYFSFLF